MTKPNAWRTIWTSGLWKTGRDFLCAFFVFAVLFSMMTADREIAGPFYLVYLALSHLGPDAGVANTASEMAASFGVQLPTQTSSSATNSDVLLTAASATTAIAVLFSIIVAFNLAFFRHLRRVHASSRRGAWRGN